MLVLEKSSRQTSSKLLGAAVHRHGLLSKEGLAERAFTAAFRDLVYPQIWEDPIVDMEALELKSDSRILTIASGGCNVLSYLTANPSHITAVDLNAAHIALNRLKLAALRHLPDHASFYRLFGSAAARDNISAYDHHLRSRLDQETRRYWDGRDVLGRRRIERFSRNFYRYGLLGRFIGAGHMLSRMHGVDPRILLSAQSREERERIFDTTVAPLFEGRLVRWLVRRPSSLFGLGIPPSQYKELSGGGPEYMAKVLLGRLRRLACDFPLEGNYFAWQAFARGYGPVETENVPPYLKAAHFCALRQATDRVSIRHISFTDYLKGCANCSLDRYVLLDAQDWMSNEDLTELWAHITRTARPGSRVIFRTAGQTTILPGRVPAEILQQWLYDEEEANRFLMRDRSAIYGGFHLYRLR